ncbi:hypothetical protein [Pseudobacteroides cellulosolvens]|uniref:Uncharacterized protein n=1 Tax=Pseudobacteroides cellulosolvens ATCC 35603 = DSM 2933 TaxID=398512 RepID=A0A0L6JJI0_9FIRM|nr:hypothetical protein [Pseudobacteroides cellulosolvens]KNY25567.1 hypothetical protein Bccel_0827 [Pseudobacteroides cellulosolvens ATCC 35603 = DSM 2933]
MDELYTVMYDGENYFKHIMSDYEKEAASKLISKLEISLSSDWGLNGLYIKYSIKIGYYVIEDNDRGHYSMLSGFPTKDGDEAFVILLAYGTNCQGFSFESKNRTQFKKEWEKCYKLKYEGRKFAFEYSLRRMDEVLGYIPDKFIVKYENYLNICGLKWKFDNALKSFVEI